MEERTRGSAWSSVWGVWECCRPAKVSGGRQTTLEPPCRFGISLGLRLQVHLSDD